MGYAIIRGMTTEQAIKHFGGQTALARVLGLKQSTVAKWPPFPPELRQLQIEAATGGVLRAEPVCDKYRVAA